MNAEPTHTLRTPPPVASPALPPATTARLAALALGLALCARASATVIDTYPDWDGNITESYLRAAQSFLAPADNTLGSWQFTLAPIASPTNVLFQIVPWDPASGPIGAPLFSRTVSWPVLGGDILVDNIKLTLTPAARYAALVDFNGYRGPSVHFELNQNSYNQGNAAWFGGIPATWKLLDSTYNTEFRAEFYAIPEPANLLGLGLATIALLRQVSRTRITYGTRGPSRHRCSPAFRG